MKKSIVLALAMLALLGAGCSNQKNKINNTNLNPEKNGNVLVNEEGNTSTSSSLATPVPTTSFASTGKWKKEYGEGDPYDYSRAFYIGYSGNENIDVWLVNVSENWDGRDIIHLAVGEKSLSKFPIDIKSLGVQEVKLDLDTINLENLKKELQGTSAEKPLSLNIKLFKWSVGEVFISPDTSSLYYKGWKFVQGDLNDNCSHPTYKGTVQIQGWLEKIDCSKGEDPYCVSLSFRVVEGDRSKLPGNVEIVYLGEDININIFKQLEKSSKESPVNVELTQISRYCEGYQPFVQIGRVL